MIKKTLSHSLKVLKISTWLSTIFALLLVLVVSFFVAFPKIIKGPIEEHLSQLSKLQIRLEKISFNFSTDGLILKAYNIDINSNDNKKRIAAVNNFRFDVNLISLFEDVYNPSDIYINTLTLYQSHNSDNFDINFVKKLFSDEVLKSLYFFKSLNINKTIIKGKNTYVIASTVIDTKDKQIILKTSDQSLDFIGLKPKVNIEAKIPLAAFEADKLLIVPVIVESNDFLLSTSFKFTDNIIDFEAYLSQIWVDSIIDYMPKELIDSDLHDWLEQSLVAGELNDFRINISKNLSTPEPIKIDLNASTKDMQLLFDKEWRALKNLNTDISLDGNNLIIKVKNTTLDNMDLKNMKVQITNIGEKNNNVEVTGMVNTQSEKLIKFLKNAPLDDAVDEVLEQFTIKGKANGYMNLIIPLDERNGTLDVEANIIDNYLTTLDGAVIVNNLNSKLNYKNGHIYSDGSGYIRDKEFAIFINPKELNENKNTFSVELVEKSSNLSLYIKKLTNEAWSAKVKSTNLKGNINISLQQKIPMVELSNFYITNLEPLDGDLDILPDDIPSMFLKSKGIFIDDYQMPDIKVDLTSKDSLLVINNLEFEGVEIGAQVLNFNGQWDGKKTNVKAKASGKELSVFLKEINFKKDVKGGEFNIDTGLFCNCTPWNVNLKDITGFINMDVKKGVFTGEDPGFGRLLSLLNIKSIAKRLKLDVDDLTAEGFSYDDISIKTNIGNSLATIEKFKLNSNSSTIDITGNSNIVNKIHNLEAVVNPTISESVPLAVYLASGNLAGLGVWLVDTVVFDGKILDSIIDKTVSFKYKITGPWENPTIE